MFYRAFIAFTAFTKFCLDIKLIALSSFYHPLINPIVNPAEILPVRGIPKLVIANQEAVVVVWTFSTTTNTWNLCHCV